MSTGAGARILELADQKAWSEMTKYEREEYARWLRNNPPDQAHNLYILIRHALHYRRRSSSETLRAVRGSDPPQDPPEDGGA